MQLVSLSNQSEFSLVNKCGIKKHGKYLIIIATNKISLPRFAGLAQTSRLLLGLKISKKLSKRAVIRNKFRRRLKHIVRLELKKGSICPLKALIIVPKIKIKEAKFKEIQDDFRFCHMYIQQRIKKDPNAVTYFI